MALNDPLHTIDLFDLDTAVPVQDWTGADFDGASARNLHDSQILARDEALLGLIKSLKSQGISNVSPQYPFKSDATLVPASATPKDSLGVTLGTFTLNLAAMKISKDFIKDARLVVAAEFRDPFISKIVFVEKTDPATNLVQVFVNLYISATYVLDQADYVILKLEDKVYNDVQSGLTPSSRDNKPFVFSAVDVNGESFLNSGTIEFGFIGSVQSTLPSSWSVGVYSGATVEGFASVSALKSIEYVFQRPATKLTQLAYTNLGNLQDAVPFLAKVKFFPFSPSATAGAILGKSFKDLEITAPANAKVFIKRIRKTGTTYVFLFAYNEYDSNNNYIDTVNIGKATVPINAGTNEFKIVSLGSNKIAGIDPTWADETIGQTKDNCGVGAMIITSYAAIGQLFTDLLASVIIGSPLVGSPVVPPQVVGITVSANLILFVEANSYLDGLAKDTIAIPVSITERALNITLHPTRNVQVSIGGIVVNRRISYGTEVLMREFYGITSVESLIDNPKVTLDDEWFDTTSTTLKRYQIVNGRRTWRNV